MFDKFSDKARAVMSYSQEEARKLGHKFVGTEHLLLALIRCEDSIASSALKALDITYDKCIEAIKQITEVNPSEIVSGYIPFTQRTKAVLEGAYHEVIEDSKKFISTEDILLSIIREENGCAMEAIRRMGVSSDAIKNAVENRISHDEGEVYQPIEYVPEIEIISGGGANYVPEERKNTGSMLHKYCRNLCEEARRGRIDPLFGRDDDINRMIVILSRRQKNNPLVLGEAGVGKTALVEGLSQRISDGRVPDNLKSKQIWLVDIASMLAGCQYRGMFEERIKGLIDEAEQDSDIILFIDEIHNLIGAGDAEGAMDASSMLKPSLARGRLHVIGATTEDEYRRYLEKDSAFERRFQTLYIEEPDVQKTIDILKTLRPRYEEHHNVVYSDEALESAARLSDRYLSDRFLPDKAIDVMDEAGARTRLGIDHEVEEIKNPEIQSAIDKLRDVRERKLEAIKQQQYSDAVKLKAEEKELIQKSVSPDRPEKSKRKKKEITAEDIANVVSSISNIPVSSISEDEAQKLLRAESVLHESVIGQDEAVDAIAKSIRRSRSSLKDPKRPGGSFLFLGPSGVGKTQLAKTLAKFLFGSEDALLTFDMSEYTSKHSISKLIGTEPGYIGYQDGGVLTKAVRRKPYSVLLFDEVEKADPEVFNIFLQLLDEGRLTDGQGRCVNFRNTVIILTSNIGAREIATTTTMGFGEETDGGLSNDEIEKRVMSEVKKYFRPEFLNRLDEIVVFNSLTQENLRQIVDLLISDIRERLVSDGISLELTDSARDFLVREGTDKIYGARPLKRAIQKHIEDVLAEDLLKKKYVAGDVIRVTSDGVQLMYEKIPPALPASDTKEIAF